MLFFSRYFCQENWKPKICCSLNCRRNNFWQPIRRRSISCNFGDPLFALPIFLFSGRLTEQSKIAPLATCEIILAEATALSFYPKVKGRFGFRAICLKIIPNLPESSFDWEEIRKLDGAVDDKGPLFVSFFDKVNLKENLNCRKEKTREGTHV